MNTGFSPTPTGRLRPESLRQTITPGAAVLPQGPAAWRLEIPAGPGGHYRLAQLDDYRRMPRRLFPWRAPLSLSARLRASGAHLPGTWGLGLWNDPFSGALFSGVETLRFPVLPQCAWFFVATEPNYLTLDDELPAVGGMAGVFRSGWRQGGRAAPAASPRRGGWLRRFARRLVQQATASLPFDLIVWHTYRLEWQVERTRFFVDERLLLDTPLSPLGPLGLVVWVDNQYMAFPPQGLLRAGTLPAVAPGWIEIADLLIE